jgi:hypothetical protein
MKYLNDYIDDQMSEIWARHGAFFAFSDKQFFEKAKEEHRPYINLGMGLICPQEMAVQMVAEIDTVIEAGIAQDIAENGLEAIIRRELDNHECYYSGDVKPVVEKLREYPGIESEMIYAVYRKGGGA